MRSLSAISDRPLRSLNRNDRLALGQERPPRRCVLMLQLGRTGPLLWNCLPVRIRAQILSGSISSTRRLHTSFLFPGAYHTGGHL